MDNVAPVMLGQDVNFVKTCESTMDNELNLQCLNVQGVVADVHSIKNIF